MTDSEQFYTGVRQLQATPEQWAAVHRIFGLPLPEAGASMLMVRSPDAMEPAEMVSGAPVTAVTAGGGPGHAGASCASEARAPMTGVVAELDRTMARRCDEMTRIMERMERNVVVVARENQELRAAKGRLEAMQGEGLFAFARKVDRATLMLFFTIVASGDVAKASRELGMKDSTLRSIIAGWRRRGKAYAALAEFVRWRKSINGQVGKELAKRVASGVDRETDYPALIRDVMEELESFNPSNWAEKCEELGELLRAVG